MLYVLMMMRGKETRWNDHGEKEESFA